MDYECEINEQLSQPVLVVRLRTPVQELPQRLGESYKAIHAYLASLGEEPVGPPFAAYYNMDLEDLDVAIGFPVARELPGTDQITADEIPGGKLASCLFTGPYVEMEDAYEALGDYVVEAGHEPTGIAYEFYLSDPTEASEEESVTRIVYPLK